MKRAAVGLGWLAASYAGTVLTARIDVGTPPPWFVTDAIFFAPLAVLLVFLVRDWRWSLVVLADLVALAVLEHVVRLPLSDLLRPLAPPPSTWFPPGPEHLPVWTAYYSVLGVLVGLVELAALWPYLKPPWMWLVFKVLGGPVVALALLWRPYLPVLGSPRAGWDLPAALLGAIALALLWQFDVKAPRLRRPPFWPPRSAEETIDPAYAAWMADLERSLENR